VVPSFSYETNATAMVVGVGLMGQFLATHAPGWFGLGKLILVDHADEITVGTGRQSLGDFAAGIETTGTTEVSAETIDVTSEEEVSDLFARHGRVNYLMHTAEISPKPLTPPEELTREDVLGACEVNLWGAHNILKQGVNSGAL
jgi:NAD(P)-dependent dehydrogenase (short-subunit alcohol dehydrogenase family)